MNAKKSPAMVVALCAAFIGVTASSAAASEHWFQFLGPDRDGVADTAAELPRNFPADGQRVVWQVALGQGYAGPAVYEDSVLLLDRYDNKRDVLRRISLANGDDIWRYEYAAPGKLPHNGSRSTPATDGETVFSIGPFGHIRAVRYSDGKLLWERHLLDDWGAKRPKWGVAQSPLLHGDRVIVAPWGRKAAVVAYEKETGDVAWTTSNGDNIILEYQSPVPMEIGGRKTIIATGRRGYAVGVDADTGERLWTYRDYPNRGWNIPSPTVIPGNRIFITGGYGCGSVMIRVNPDDWSVTELWRNKNMGTRIHQALLHEGHLYANSADVGGGLRCINLDGELQWDSRSDGEKFGLGGILLVNDLIFIVNGDNGEVHLAEATPKGYQELGKAKLLGGSKVWAPLAYKGGMLVLRDQRKLVCVDLNAR